MRLVGISTVKNESDIIESFVRHNLGFLDRLHVVDNGSTDTTGEILAELVREYPGLTVERDPYLGHMQEGKLTAVARALVAKEPFDFLFAIDADEFLRCASREALETALAKLPDGACGAAPWVTYVPTPGDDREELDPARRIRHRRAEEPEALSKVAVPVALAAKEDFRLWPGNHLVGGGGVRLIRPTPLEGVTLAHFPVRSGAQLVSKVLLGEWALRTKMGRMTDEGWHWKALADEIERNPHITEQRAFDFAAGYTEKGSRELVRDPLALAPSHRLTMPERINVNLLERVVKFAGSHFAEQAHTLYGNRHMAIARTATGVLAYPRADLVVGRSLAMYGEWAEMEIRLMLSLLRPGDTVLDVGACIGTHAVRFAQRVGPRGMVQAFEPQRLIYQILCANAALNQVANLHAHQAAVGEQDGYVQIEDEDPSRPRNVGNFSIEGGKGGAMVRQVALDSLKFPPVRLIKVDVEGMEERVLKGAVRLIERDRPALFVENNIPERSESLLRAIAALGYRAWWHFEPYYNPKNYYGNKVNFLASVQRPEINVLALRGDASITHPALVPVRDPAQTWQEAHAQLGSRA
jgi:FkbM family methyltransferase